MTDVPAQGALTKVGFDVDATTVGGFDASSQGIEAITCSMRQVETRLHSGGLRGTRSRHQSRNRIVSQRSTGTFVCNPTAAEIDWLLPYILGGATAGGVTDVANTLPTFSMLVDKGSKRFVYTGCVVGRAVFAASQGGAVSLSLDIEATAEATGSDTAFPSAVPFTSASFFVLSDCAFTWLSSARKFSQFELAIDNMLDADRFNNSLTRAQIVGQDRAVQLSLNTPYTSDNVDLYAVAVAGGSGTLAVADGSVTYTVAFGNMRANNEGPELGGKTEIRLPLRLDAFATDSASECKFTKT